MALKMKRHKGARKGKEMSEEKKGDSAPKSIIIPGQRPPTKKS